MDSLYGIKEQKTGQMKIAEANKIKIDCAKRIITPALFTHSLELSVSMMTSTS